MIGGSHTAAFLPPPLWSLYQGVTVSRQVEAVSPKVIVPGDIADTISPEFPNCLYSIKQKD